MNLAVNISLENDFNRDFNKWLSDSRTLRSSTINTSTRGLRLIFRFNPLAKGSSLPDLSEFTEGKEKANLSISSLSSIRGPFPSSVRESLSDYLGVSYDEYDNILNSIKHEPDCRSDYEENPVLLALYDFLYLLEDKYKHSTAARTIFIVSHLPTIRYTVDRDEAFELYSSLMTLLNSK